MATKLNFFFIAFFMFMLAGCFKTELPVYSQKHHTSTKHSSSHASTYKVRSRDTLYSIGRRFGINYKTLARNNHIRSPYTIYTGQRIYLRGVAPRSRTLPVAKQQYKAKRAKKSVRKTKKYSKRSTIKSTKSSRLRWPVDGVLTSHFGRRGSRMHDGIDIGAKEGTAIHAAAAGEVVYSDHRLSGYGRLIIIRHRHDLFTAYAHNQRNLVRKGDRVKTGDVIARVGHTGRATGPHLHFEVRRGPTPVDPLSYLPKKR